MCIRNNLYKYKYRKKISYKKKNFWWFPFITNTNTIIYNHELFGHVLACAVAIFIDCFFFCFFRIEFFFRFCFSELLLLLRFNYLIKYIHIWYYVFWLFLFCCYFNICNKITFFKRLFIIIDGTRYRGVEIESAERERERAREIYTKRNVHT